MSTSETQPLIPLRLVRVVFRESSNEQWIFLEEDIEAETRRGFPIVIGSGEANEIHRIVTDVPTARPLTHQLALNAIHALGSRLVGVDIVDLRSNTFYAQLRLAPPNGTDPEGADEILIDSRPSDALALALRAGAQIRVVETVLELVRTDSAPDVLPEPGAFDLDEIDDVESGETDGPEDDPEDDPEEDSEEEDPE